MSSSGEFSEILNRIRGLDDSLKRANLTAVEVSVKNGEAVFRFVSNKVVGEEVIKAVEETLKGVMPKRFSGVKVYFSKLVADAELISRSVEEFVKKEFISISRCVSSRDVDVVIGDETCVYTINADSDVCDYMEENGVIGQIDEYLSGIYCNDFIGKIKNIGLVEFDAELKTDETADIRVRRARTLKVGDVVKLWGEDVGNTATYIADYNDAFGEARFAGKIVNITEKKTKNDKPYFVLDLDDTTGKISGKVFMTKEKTAKMEKLQVGSEIITRGELELFNGSPSYLIKDVSFCVFPKDFVPEERKSNPVPKEYKLIFPKPIVEYSQDWLFAEEKPVLDCLKGKSFVVVDIETTGIKYYLGDRITEIGAVKITDGKIAESFTTLIDPKMPISEEITKLTGIDGEMVKGKPTFEEVLPDFYKFCYGSAIVAHNIEFDYKFIKYMAKDTDYVFKNEGIDTLAMSMSLLRGMKNYKLNTVCAHFGIEFLHHRAMSDAHATAKLFLELVNIKKSL